MYTSGKHSWLKHVDFMVIDLVSLALAFAGAYYLRFGDLGFLTSTEWQSLLAILLLLNLVITVLTNPYSGITRRPYYEDALKNFMLALYSFICACVFFYIFKLGENYSRLMLAGMYIIYYLFSLLLKCIRKKALLSSGRANKGNDARRMLLVTTCAQADQSLEYITSTEYKIYEVQGIVLVDGEGGLHEYAELPVIPFKGFANYAVRSNFDDVFVDIDPHLIDSKSYVLLVEGGLSVHLNIEGMLGIQTDSQEISRVGIYKSLNVGAYKFGVRQALYFMVKRVLDVVFGIVGCILLVPVMLVTKISYLVSHDSAPIMYKQTRIGKRGKPFQLYKLRTMVPDADKALAELLQDGDRFAEWEEKQKLTDDPRITKVGAFLRRTSLDEFPQFINVVKGDMSIVGPRPLIPDELQQHDGLTLYNKVRPGITGWWACNGRSNISYRERLELEYHYVKHCSFYLDTLCVLRTFFAVLKREGAE